MKEFKEMGTNHLARNATLFSKFFLCWLTDVKKHRIVVFAGEIDVFACQKIQN